MISPIDTVEYDEDYFMKTTTHDKKTFIQILLLVLLAFGLMGCNGNVQTKSSQASQGADQISMSVASTVADTNVDRVEVFHFHGTNQCYSCITVGNYAEETVNTYFADEVASGKVRFEHINGELPENLDLVKQYGATGSSLWIGVYNKNGTFSAEQNTNVWYKINDKPEYLAYLKGVIEQKLAGR